MIGFPCLFRLLTGIYCPGCGGTRAAFVLLGGHVAGSFYYHPLVPFLAVAVPFLIVYYIDCRRKRKIFSEKIWKSILFFGIFLMAANFAVKNYLLFFRHIDVLEMLDAFYL